MLLQPHDYRTMQLLMVMLFVHMGKGRLRPSVLGRSQHCQIFSRIPMMQSMVVNMLLGILI